MTKEDFIVFTRNTLEEAIELAERETGLRLSRDICFRWGLSQETAPVCADVAEYITERVFVGPEQIYPCVDLGVIDVLEDGRTLMAATVAGYAPRPMGANWTGRYGPYVLMYGKKLTTKAQEQQ
jgi:hypothetical protein